MKQRQDFPDPYREVIDALNRGGVRYVVVGMSGINYYASAPSELFGTLDYDIFLEPSIPNVKKAVTLLEGMGFSLATVDGLFEGARLRQVVRDRRTVVATTPEGIMVELLLQVSGYPFSELARDAATFDVNGVPVRVGRLAKLVQSKFLAGRPKDRAFLKRYQALLEEETKQKKPPNPSKRRRR